MLNSGKNFRYATGNAANLAVFVPLGLNVLTATGAIIPDALGNRSLCGLPVYETYAGSGNYTWDVPAAAPPFYAPIWEVYRLAAPPTFAGPPADTVVWEGEGDPLNWGGAAVLVPTGTPLSRYSFFSLQDVYDFAGSLNTQLAEDLDSNQDPATIARRGQACLDYACDEMDMELAGGVWQVPITGQSASDGRWLAKRMAALASAWLYSPRNPYQTGAASASPQATNYASVFAREDAKARRDLNLLAGGQLKRLQTAARISGAGGGTGILVSPAGTNQAIYPIAISPWQAVY